MLVGMSASHPPIGTVHLVGAGPGDPDLLTRKAERLIRSCDALVFDYLIDTAILQWTKDGCQKICVGKRAGFHSLPQPEIENVLVGLARKGLDVVRLKGGDPFVFGRGGEEMQRLREAGVPHEIVPAVTASLGAAAAAGIPLSHRSHNSSIVFLTGHEDPEREGSRLDWARYGALDTTLCLYMAVRQLPAIVERLLAGGLDPDTPAAAVQWATMPDECICTGRVADIARRMEETEMASPAIIIIGRTAALARARPDRKP